MEAQTDSPKSSLRSQLPLIHSGKVRDTYRLRNENGMRLRLPYVTNRISIFDFVLPAEIPYKGEVLNAMNIYNRIVLMRRVHDVMHDLHAYGHSVAPYLPAQVRGDTQLWKHVTVTQALIMLPVEFVVRQYLTGTGYTSYKKTREVCGHILPPYLAEGTDLIYPIPTPTTKAQDGHDVPLNYHDVNETYGVEWQASALKIFSVLQEHAESCGLILADWKGEAGFLLKKDGSYVRVWGDEMGTPDCMRLWRKSDYDECFPERLPPSLDKQYMRDWGTSVGINMLDPKDPAHRAQVAAIEVPPDVMARVSEIYLEVFELWTGVPLQKFQEETMGIPYKKE